MAEDADDALSPAPVPAPPRRGAARWVALVGAVALVVLTGALAFAQMQRADDAEQELRTLEDESDERRAVAQAAGAFGEALLTYDHTDLDAARERVAALATDDFASEYSSAFLAGLSGAITELEAVSEATARDVYVADVDGDTAKAIVTLDSTVHSAAGTRRTIGSYLDMTLERVDGEWKVDTVTSIAALDEERTPATPAPG